LYFLGGKLTVSSTTREFVAGQAITFVTNSFNQMKQVRIANYNALVKSLPYWPIYEQYHGRPPLHPQVLANLQRQLHEADVDLRRSIDADWKTCVVRYPDVLVHYYSQINVTIPKISQSPQGVLPTLPSMGAIPPLSQTPAPARSMAMSGVTAEQKKARRKSTSSRPGDGLAGYAGINMNMEMIKRQIEMEAAQASAKHHQGFGGQGHDFATLLSGGINRTSSKAGRGTPVPSTGKKRMSKEYVLAGLAAGMGGRRSVPPPTAPPPPVSMVGRFG
jgi:hypothetical protein